MYFVTWIKYVSNKKARSAIYGSGFFIYCFLMESALIRGGLDSNTPPSNFFAVNCSP